MHKNAENEKIEIFCVSRKKAPHEGGAETDQETLLQIAPFRGPKKRQGAWEALNRQFIDTGIICSSAPIVTGN